MEAEKVAESLADLGARVEVLEGRSAWPLCGAHAARLVSLEAQQTNQNAQLIRIEDKVDSLKTILLGATGALVLALGGLLVDLLRHAK